MERTKSELRSLKRRIDGVTMPIGRKRMKWGRNWSCLCGSDKKYKNCCLEHINQLNESDDNATVEGLPKDIQEMIDARKKGLKKSG